MYKLAEIASYLANSPTYASIMVSDGMFSSDSCRFWLCSEPKMVISRPPDTRPACFRASFGLAPACTYWAPAAAPML